MQKYDIHILCIQETHRAGSEYFITNHGSLVILAGSNNHDHTEHAGVGFIFAPHVRSSLINFCQHNSRLCYLKLKIKGGKLAIISAYAPHAGHPFDERQRFFDDLGDMHQALSCNGGCIIAGDMNSRLYERLPTENKFIGDYAFLSGSK